MIDYLSGGESANATRMNALFMELDGRMSTMLSNKSLFMGQSTVFPASLLGKVFFFSGGHALYSDRVPGRVANPDGTTVSYTHAPFTTLASSLTDADFTAWDDTNHVGTLKAANGRGNYSSTTTYNRWNWVGYYDPANGYALSNWLCIADGTTGTTPTSDPTKWIAYTPSRAIFAASLEAHKYTRTVAGNQVIYYIQEPGYVPEKHYDWAVAEIVCEGTSAVGIDPSWDKYNFFRIHNLSMASVTVYFEKTSGVTSDAYYEVIIPAMGTATVRRDDNKTNYRQGLNYLWSCEGGDPRFYWFHRHPLDDNRPSDGMAANNLTNPSYCIDLVQYFTREVDVYPNNEDFSGTSNTKYCGLTEDVHEQVDFYPAVASLFGDPSDPATIFGDLIHHKGDITIVRFSKTKHDILTGYPAVTLDSVRFNGYATLVADFAAKQLSVVEYTDQNYKITNSDPNNDVYLIPFGTNLFKTGEEIKVINLSGTSSYKIESNIFLTTADGTTPDNGNNLTSTPGQAVWPPTIANTTTSKTWWDPTAVQQGYPVPAGAQDLGPTGEVDGTGHAIRYYINPTVVDGPTLVSLKTPGRTTTKQLKGIHKYTVADITNLSFWGDPSLSSQANTDLSISDQKLMFTSQGLAMLFTETYSGKAAGDYTNSYFAKFRDGKAGIPQKRVFYFQAHGWPYISDLIGSASTGWLTPARGRFRCANNFTQDDVGPDGADFKFGKLNTTEEHVNVLRRVYKEGAAGLNISQSIIGIRKPDASHRFWQTVDGADGLTSLHVGLGWRPLFNAVSKRQNTSGADVFRITGLTIKNGGSSFTVGQVLNVPGALATVPTGSKAAAEASIRVDSVSSGSISGVTLTDSGWYSAAGTSTVTISGAEFGITWEAIPDISTVIYSEDPDYQEMLLPNGWTDTRWNTWFYQKRGTFAIGNSPGWTDGQTALPIAMPLTAESYNIIAREINSRSSAVPLDYHTLRWSFTYSGTDYIMQLDPQAMGGISGYQLGYNPGASNRWTPGSKPVPMSLFASFDEGSLYALWLTSMGVPIKNADDCPWGGISRDEESAAQIHRDKLEVTASGTSVTVGTTQPDGYASCVVDSTLNLTLTCENLTMTSLMAGAATGDDCLGTLDPNAITATEASPDGKYYIASTDSTDGSIKKGDMLILVMGSPIGGGTGYAMASIIQRLNRQTGIVQMQDGSTLNMRTDYNYMTWVKISDISTLLSNIGFDLSYLEMCIPYNLKKTTGIYPRFTAIGGATGTQKIHHTDWEINGDAAKVGNWCEYVDAITKKIITRTVQDANQMLYNTGYGGCPKPPGVQVRFYQEWRIGSDGLSSAAWKVVPYANNRAWQYICDIKSRPNLLPALPTMARCVMAVGDLGIDGHYLGSSYDPWTSFDGPTIGPPGSMVISPSSDTYNANPVLGGSWNSSPGYYYIRTDGGLGLPGTMASDLSIPVWSESYTLDTDMTQINYTEGSTNDMREVRVLNVVGSATSVDILLTPVYMESSDYYTPRASWCRDFGWSGLDNLAVIDSNETSPSGMSFIGWTKIDPIASKTVTVGGSVGAHTINADGQQRQMMCFDMRRGGIRFS